MKFFKSSLLVGLFTSGSFAQSPESADDIAVPSIEKIQIGPIFPSSPVVDGDRVELTNGHETPFKFVVNNGESYPFSVLAFGGSFYDEKDNRVYANLTNAQIGPYTVKPGESVEIEHNLKLNLPPQEFALEFLLFLQYGIDEERQAIYTLRLNKQPVSIVDEPVSFWDPRYLLVQLVLGATMAGAGYYLSKTFLLPYLEPKKQPAKTNKKEKATSSGVSVSNGKSYDESWIPEQHLKKR